MTTTVLEGVASKTEAAPTLVPPEKCDALLALRTQIEEAEAAVRQLRIDMARWEETVTEAAHEIANYHDWCGVADDVMDEVGIPTRTSDVEVTLTVHAETTDLNDIRYSFPEMWSALDGDGFRLEHDFEVEVTVSSRGCGCDEVDTDEVYGHLPSWAQAGDWEITYRSCGNC